MAIWECVSALSNCTKSGWRYKRQTFHARQREPYLPQMIPGAWLLQRRKAVVIRRSNQRRLFFLLQKKGDKALDTASCSSVAVDNGYLRKPCLVRVQDIAQHADKRSYAEADSARVLNVMAHSIGKRWQDNYAVETLAAHAQLVRNEKVHIHGRWRPCCSTAPTRHNAILCGATHPVPQAMSFLLEAFSLFVSFLDKLHWQRPQQPANPRSIIIRSLKSVSLVLAQRLQQYRPLRENPLWKSA